VAMRPAITATTGGLGHAPVSIAEDVLSTFLSIIAIIIPIIVGIILVLLTTTFIWWWWRRSNAKQSA